MGVEKFLLLMQLGITDCPNGVHPSRWSGMLRWYSAYCAIDPEILDAMNNHGQ